MLKWGYLGDYEYMHIHMGIMEKKKETTSLGVRVDFARWFVNMVIEGSMGIEKDM